MCLMKQLTLSQLSLNFCVCIQENRLEFEKFCMDDFPNIEDSIEDDETNAADLYENVDDGQFVAN